MWLPMGRRSVGSPKNLGIHVEWLKRKGERSWNRRVGMRPSKWLSIGVSSIDSLKLYVPPRHR